MTLWTPPLGKDTRTFPQKSLDHHLVRAWPHLVKAVCWEATDSPTFLSHRVSPPPLSSSSKAPAATRIPLRLWFSIDFLFRTCSFGNLEVGETGGSSDLLEGGGAGGSPETWWEPRDWVEAREERRSGRCSGGLRLVVVGGGWLVVVVCQLCLSLWLPVVVLCQPCLSASSAFASPTITSGAASVLETWYLRWLGYGRCNVNRTIGWKFSVWCINWPFLQNQHYP